MKPAQDQAVSNGSAPAQPHLSQHPAIKRASILRSVAETLAGGPSVNVRIDGAGNKVVTKTPLSPRHIAMAIALEAIQGSLTGLAAGRGKGPGAAGFAAMQQSIAQRQKQRDYQDEQARREFEDRQKALSSKAAISEVNSRTLLNVSESEKYGAESLDKLIEINRASGLLDVDPDILENGGTPLTPARIARRHAKRQVQLNGPSRPDRRQSRGYEP